MLSGVAENAKQKAEAEKLARAVEGVKKLYNEILVIKAIDKKKGAIEGFVDDTVIESKINALLLDAGGVNVTNFRWRPVGGGGRRASVGAVRDDLLDEGKQAPNLPQHHDSAVTVLNIGRMNLRPQHPATRLSALEKQWLKEIDKAFAEAVTVGNEIIALTDAMRGKLERFEADLEEIDRILDDDIQVLILAETHRAAKVKTLSPVITRPAIRAESPQYRICGPLPF